MSVASAVSQRRRGFTLLHSLVPMLRPGGETAVLSAKAKDFCGGRNGERGEIASSASGGRGIYEHSPKAKRLLNTWIETNTTKSGNPERAAAVFSGEIPAVKRRDSRHASRRLHGVRRAIVALSD